MVLRFEQVSAFFHREPPSPTLYVCMSDIPGPTVFKC